MGINFYKGEGNLEVIFFLFYFRFLFDGDNTGLQHYSNFMCITLYFYSCIPYSMVIIKS